MKIYGIPFDHIERNWTWSETVGLLAVMGEEPKQSKGGLPLRHFTGR
jgi:hypothetical protein